MLGRPAGPGEAGPSITVFHLVWAPLGPGRLGQFLDSYRAHPAGVTHRLHVLFNGFDCEAAAAPCRALLNGVPHDATVLAAPVQDINAYLQGARAAVTSHVCFTNSYSRFLAPGWLAKLHDHARRDSVGLVGATGSYESVLTESLRAGRPWSNLGRNVLRWPERYTRHRADRAAARRAYERLLPDYEPFPNPHIRTNGFMIRRDLLLSLGDVDVRSKEDALRFEGGRAGLTRQVLRAGLDALIVGRDGRGYPVAEWPRSRTFRSGAQDNLLIADNRTEQFAAATPGERRALAAAAWSRAPAQGPPRDPRPAPVTPPI